MLSDPGWPVRPLTVLMSTESKPMNDNRHPNGLVALPRGQAIALGLSLLPFWGPRRGPRTKALFEEAAGSVSSGARKNGRAGGWVEVQNVNIPGQLKVVDAHLYKAMRAAFLQALPRSAPGLTAAEVRERLHVHLPEGLFPGEAKVGWWAKTVQLDLEAKGLVSRGRTRPTRWHRT